MNSLNEHQLSSNLNARLRLKRIDINGKSVSPEKVDLNKIQSTEESKMQNQLCNDDSLADFKTPKRDIFTRSKVQKRKQISMINVKAKSKMRHKDNNFSKQTLVRKESSNSGQTLIESSFFKTKETCDDVPDNAKLGHMCPLCFKILKNATTQALHMKTCASKNNISTKKLFEAKELQERQAAERASLGLPSAPVLQDKKKPTPRRMISNENSDLDLAMALSKSLHEHEDIWELKDSIEFNQSTATHISRIARSDCDGTLQTFGFMSNKPVTVKRKGKIIGRTTLQTRDQAERERLLTERIAEVLMTDDTVTQPLCQEISKNAISKETVTLKSQRLRKIHQVEHQLWDKTRLSPNQKTFYVKSLSPYVVRPGTESSKQSPVNDNHDMIKSRDNEHHASETHDSPQTPVKTVMISVDEHNIDSGIDKDLCTSVNENSETIGVHKFITSLVSDWSNTLNNSAMSDLVIFVEEDKHIWTHRLVFSVRCSNILLDATPNNSASTSSAKEKILWPDIPYTVALAFLEFVYCGTIRVNSQILKDKYALLKLRYLARKYKMKDVFNYLRVQSKMYDLKSSKDDCVYRHVTTPPSKLNLRRSVCEITVKKCSNLDKSADETSENENSEKSATSLCANGNFSPLHLENPENNKTTLSQNASPSAGICRSRENSVSPDLFDDEDAITSCDTRKSNNTSILRSSSIYDNNEHVIGSVDFHSGFSNIENVSPGQSTPVNVRQKVQTEIGSASSNVDQFSPSLLNLSDASLLNTPKSSKLSKSEVTSSRTNAKRKGNLTLFIEKVQMENAKSICDSDSDMESVMQVRPKWKRNPFNINKYDDSICTPPSENNLLEQGTKKRRHGLSKLEDEIRIDAIKNPQLYSLPSKQEHVKELQSTGATSPTSTTKKRKISDSLSETNMALSPIIVKEINIHNKRNIATDSPIKTQRYSKASSVSEVDTDENDVSMYSKYKRKRVDNSIAKYRSRLKISQLQNSQQERLVKESLPAKQKSNSGNVSKVNDRFANIADTDSIIELSDWESDDSTTSTIILPKNNSNNVRRTGKAECSERRTSTSAEGTNISNKNVESHNINRTGLPDERSTHNITFSRAASIDPNIYDAETDTENDSNTHKHQNEVEYISNHRIWSGNSINERFNTNHGMNSERDEEIGNSSADSPEICVEPDDMGFEGFDTLDIDTGVNVDNISYVTEDGIRKEIFNSSPVSISSSPKYDVQTSQPTSGQHRASNIGIVGTNDRENRSVHTHDRKYSELGCVPVSLGTNISKARMSDSCDKDMHTEMTSKNNKLQVVGSSTPQQKKVKSNHGVFPKPVYIITDRNVTPPPDYSSMPTPELHANLRKYGLKLHKRKTAVKLLSYIYDQLHPLVPIDAENDIEENENKISVSEIPAIQVESCQNMNAKKQDANTIHKLNRSLSQSSSSSNNSRGSNRATKGNIKDLKIEQEAKSDVGSATNVKEAFIRLLRHNKELYTKILTYEPLDIHALQAMLKVEGFKCRLNVLMNFLDEQCITFQLLERNPKGSTRPRQVTSK